MVILFSDLKNDFVSLFLMHLHKTYKKVKT